MTGPALVALVALLLVVAALLHVRLARPGRHRPATPGADRHLAARLRWPR